MAGYAAVAGHCIAGGFDGIELQCSHSSIVRGFLSPATNRRTDDYGGPLPNRARLLLEIVDAVRETIGSDHVLGVRLCGDELIEGGTTIDDAVAVARMVDAGGRVDYINTSIGVATATLYMIEASMQVPPGYAMFIPSAIREAVGIPVVGVGRFKDPLQADRALEAGQCDLVGVVRGQIADADFAAKARSGHATEIRSCLSCNQECVGRMGLNRWLGCIENPRTGLESVALPAPRRRSRVLVVGGGPGGLQAAVTAAERGHQVTLVERADRLGGQVQVAASVPSRAEFLDIVRNLITHARRLDIEMRLGTEADAGLVEAEHPDAVVLATGARPLRPWWSGDHPRVVDVRDVLEGRVGAVWGRGARRRARVPPGDVHGRAVGRPGLPGRGGANGMVVGPGPRHHPGHGDLEREGRRQGDHPERRPRPDGGRPGRSRRPGGPHPPAPPDRARRACACATGWSAPSISNPRTTCGGSSRAPGAGFPVHRVGDCLAPRRAHAAVIEGHRVAVAL